LKLRLALLVLPLVVLAGLLALFATNINRDPSLVQSVLINRPAPRFDLAAVPGLAVPGFATADLKGAVTVVNVFASWCVPCRAEHPVLMQLQAESDVRLYGINQKDAAENAVAFLTELGNPYTRVGADTDNRVSIDWGVYGVPETFVVDADGVITYKHVGPLTPAALVNELLPAIARAKQAGNAAG
jgi:cytochrome c biogenesis protein CcmG/thiol:disulfide interchange protein DsbE